MHSAKGSFGSRLLYGRPRTGGRYPDRSEERTAPVANRGGRRFDRHGSGGSPERDCRSVAPDAALATRGRSVWRDVRLVRYGETGASRDGALRFTHAGPAQGIVHAVRQRSGAGEKRRTAFAALSLSGSLHAGSRKFGLAG